VRGVTWGSPGRALFAPDVRKHEIPSIVAEATTVQFQTPLPTGTMQALAAAMRERPEVELYLYAYGGWGPLDGSLSFLAGFEHLRSLSLALEELPGFEGLARFTELRELSLRLRACAFFCVSGVLDVVGDAVSEVDAQDCHRVRPVVTGLP